MHGQLVGFCALLLLLLLGSWGWGSTLLTLAERWGWSGAQREIGAPLQVAIGVALFLAVGGWLVAFNIAWFPVLITWHVIGIGALALRPGGQQSDSLTERARNWWHVIGFGVLGALLTTMAIGNSIGFQFDNHFDDEPAYLYLAERLLKTGGLIDPFNQRRLANYGGATLYQALFLRISGNSSLRGLEYTFAALLVVALVIRSTRRRLPVLGGAAVGLGVIFGQGIGAIANLSPTFSGTALSLGTLQLLGWIRSRSLESQRLLYPLIGLLVAGVMSLRFYFVIAVAVAVAGVILFSLHGMERVRALGLVAAGYLPAELGWAVADYRSSKTPLFPLIDGNYNPAYPGATNPHLRLSAVEQLARHVFTSADVGWIAALAVAFGLVALAFDRRTPARQLTLVFMGVGCLVEIALLARSLDGGQLIDIVRFVAPTTFACALYGIDLVWPMRADVTSSDNEEPGSPGAWRLRLDRSPIRLLATVTALALFGACAFGETPAGYDWAIRHNLDLGREVLTGGAGFGDHLAGYESTYDQLNRLVPPGAKVLAAVDLPSLLDFNRFDFATLDIVGNVSPAPYIPILKGTSAVVAYLRHLGYQYIAVDGPTDPWTGLYDFPEWKADLKGPVYAYAAWAKYFVAWQGIVTQLSSDGHYRVQHAGWLSLIDIERR